MSAIERIDKPHLMSISALARCLRKSRDIVRGGLDSAGIAPAGGRGGYPVYDLREVLDLVLADQTPDLMSPFERRAHYQAQSERLQLELREGRLVTVMEVERDYAEVFQLVARAFETVPDVLERDAGLKPHQVAVVEKHLDEVREALYEQLVAASAVDE